MFVKSGNKNLRHREIINYEEETFSFSYLHLVSLFLRIENTLIYN